MSDAPSLYRRHRPRTFAQVVGQEHVVRTLRNAVEQGKVHHAYLFVGSRGTGKTSMAKILAACLNCVDGPTVEPCGRCESCVAIAGATSLDVIEMDAASNNSVDDIRELREKVGYAPLSGSHKIYILDEAHMLTSQAWNAFLKTLEEPPPNTIFVLATTEANKVLPTVVDRCHRFDFARPAVEQISTVIRRASQAESIEIGPDAVALLARHASGSFRDALGTLEQLVTYAGTTIATDDVLAVLGVADAEVLFSALDAIASGDARAALLTAAELARTGRDALGFVQDLEAHARDLMIVQTIGEVPPELRITPDRDARLQEQSGRVGPASVARLLDLLARAMEATRNGSDARTQLELALVKAAVPAVDPSTRALLARVERLEAALAGAPGATVPPAPNAQPPAVAPAPPPVAPAPAPKPVTPEPAAAAPPAPKPPAPEAVEPPPVSSPASPPPPPQPQRPSRTQDGHELPPLPDESYFAGGEEQPPVPPGRPARSAQPGAAAVPAPPSPPAAATPPPPAPPPAAAAAAAGPAAPGLPVDVGAMREMWPAVLDGVREVSVLCGAFLTDARPARVDDETLVIGLPPHADFARRRVDTDDNRKVLVEAIRSVTGSRVRVAFELLSEEASLQTGTPAPARPTDEQWVERFKEELEAEEIIPDPPESEAT